jgi:uncharacterized membrane-anchored protein YjiN (DUF445 family)
MVLSNFAGPVIGAVIGYCTNFIAVKMLFYPRKEIRVFGHRLPFTPGAIPKGKERLARAIGNIVTTTLVTEDDITEKLLSDSLTKNVEDKVMDFLGKSIKQDISAFTQADVQYGDIKKNASQLLTVQIMEAVDNLNIGQIIAAEGGKLIREKTQGTMLAMFVSDELIESIIGPVGEQIEGYIAEHGKEYIEPEIEARLTAFEEKSGIELLGELGLQPSELRKTIAKCYQGIVKDMAGSALKQFNLAGIVEDKINAMSIDELEKMVLSVMKKELDVIVNLGALIGFVLGLLNMFF